MSKEEKVECDTCGKLGAKNEMQWDLDDFDGFRCYDCTYHSKFNNLVKILTAEGVFSPKVYETIDKRIKAERLSVLSAAFGILRKQMEEEIRLNANESNNWHYYRSGMIKELIETFKREFTYE